MKSRPRHFPTPLAPSFGPDLARSRSMSLPSDVNTHLLSGSVLTLARDDGSHSDATPASPVLRKSNVSMAGTSTSSRNSHVRTIVAVPRGRRAS